MTTHGLAALVPLAETQLGLFSISQAESLGVDRRTVLRAARRGLVRRLHSRVFGFSGTELTDRALAVAAVLQGGPDGVASHECSLVLHGLDQVPFTPVVTLPVGSVSSYPGIRVHRSADLAPEHVDHTGVVPVTTLERAVVDLASVFSRPRLEWWVDRLTIRERLVTVGAIARVERQINGKGRARIKTLRTVLDARSPGEPALRSRLESLVDELLLPTGLPTPIREYPLPSLIPGEGLVDRAWPDVKLLLEIDGRVWHAREQDMAKDRARDRAAAAAGWQTLRILDSEVADVPELVRSDIVNAYLARRTQLAV